MMKRKTSPIHADFPVMNGNNCCQKAIMFNKTFPNVTSYVESIAKAYRATCEANLQICSSTVMSDCEATALASDMIFFFIAKIAKQKSLTHLFFALEAIG